MKYIRLFGLVGLLSGLAVISIDCAATMKPMETEADFVGFVTEISPYGEREILGQVFVESHADKVVTKYVITVKDETLIFRMNGDNLHKVDFRALENKQWVKIWFKGSIMESFPMQATASQIVIISAETKPTD